MNTFPQQPSDDLRVDTAWRENYSGASMNRKLHGLLPKGVYAGFSVSAAGGLNVKVSAGGDVENIAVIEVDEFSLTARMPLSVSKTLALTPGKKNIVVLEAQYAMNQASTVGIFARESVPGNAIELATIDLTDGNTSIENSDIKLALPAKPVSAADFAELAAFTLDTARRLFELQEEFKSFKNT